MDTAVAPDLINRRTWGSRQALDEYAHGASWSDAGEQAAFAWLAPRCRNGPLLDIGVGAGRTIPLMLRLSSDYTGIDYTPTLLARSRARFPHADLRYMDARDMSALPASNYALTAFSCNGIDSVCYDDRERILTEMFRVTRPGGFVFFSTHNRDGPGFRETPLTLLPAFSVNPLRFAWRVLRALRLSPLAIVNYLRHVRLHRDYSGYSIKTAAVHSFGIVIVYTTLTEQRRQLAALGLELDAVFASANGARLADEARSTDTWWMHFIAHKPR
jgi:SAM-dependent methyltransferase